MSTGFTLSPSDRDDLAAVEVLASQGTAALEALIARLSEKSWAVRRAVIAALAHLGDPAVAPLSHTLVADRSNEARIASTVEALVASCGNPEAALLALLSHPNTAIICDAIVILGRRRNKSAIAELEKLTAHNDSNVALAAIEALGRIGDNAGLDTLLALVRGRDFFRTFPAIEVLGHSRDSRAVAILVALLDEPLYAAHAARSLGETQDATLTEPLVRALAMGDESLARSVAVALVSIAGASATNDSVVSEHMGKADRAKSIAQINDAWPGADSKERNALTLLLGWIGGKESIAALFKLLSNADDIGHAAQRALRRAGRDADAAILDVIADATSAQRKTLLPLIGGAPKGSAALARALDDDDPEVRAAACDALARVGDTVAVPALFRMLSDDDSRVARAALGAVQSLGCNETEALALNAATSSDARLRRAAVRIIAYFGFKSGLSVLVAASEDEDDRVREAALSGLPFLEEPLAPAALLAATRHPSAKTRAVAVRAVAQLTQSDEVVTCLERSLTDSDAWVRYYACLSIGRLKLTGITPKVIELLLDSAGQVRVAAIEALSNMRGNDAQTALIAATRSPDLDLSRAALVALGAFSSKEAMGVLLDHVGSSDAAARLMALTSAANFEGAEVTQVLRSAVLDADESVRSGAVSLLADRLDPLAGLALIDLLDQPQAQDIVATALASREKHVAQLTVALETASAERSEALCAVLARMSVVDAESALLAALDFTNVFARRAAVKALATMRSAAAIKALRHSANNDNDPEVRARSKAALR